MIDAAAHAVQVRNRLRYPTNAVVDLGIDLKRKEQPKMPVHQPKTMPIDRGMPYGIGTSTPSYTLSYHFSISEGPVSVRAIQRAVAQRFGITVSEMLSARRTADLVRPRQIAMYLSKKITRKSLPEIGRRFAGRDHTTILHSVRKIEVLRTTDPELDAVLDQIAAQFTSHVEDTPCSSTPTQTSTAP